MNSDDFEVQFQEFVEAPSHLTCAELDSRLQLFTSRRTKLCTVWRRPTASSRIKPATPCRP
jgi:hypothetical protein